MSPRLCILLAAINGFLAVGLGAFGAHGLRSFLAAQEDGAQRMDWWETAAHYHLTHALLLFGVGLWLAQQPSTPVRVAAYSLLVGIVLFSGSLYAMTLSGIRVLGAITPLGGAALLVGWAALAVAALRSSGK